MRLSCYRKWIVLSVVCLGVAAIVLVAQIGTRPLLAEVTPGQGAGGTVILETRQAGRDREAKAPNGTIWRTFQTWRTDVARTEKGDLVNVDPMAPRGGEGGRGAQRAAGQKINPAAQVHGSAFPPANWQAVDFDDHDWTRDPVPQRPLYGLIALTCLRGKFQVTDPANAKDLSLTVRFRGGAVAYLNGREIGRAFLPKGDIKPDTLADDYPKEAYIDADGALIGQGANGSAYAPAVDDFGERDPETAKRYKSRCRALEVTIPASALVKGRNVLAIEIHRAPAWEGMFTSQSYVDRKKQLALDWGQSWWDRATLEDVKLSAAPGNAIVPNVAPATGFRLWNHPACQDIDPAWYGDPNDPLVRVRDGLKNGSYSGMLVASSTEAIKGIEAHVTDLTGPAGTIPASAITVSYARLADGFEGSNLKGTGEGSAADGSGGWTMFDILDSTAPKDIPKTQWSRGRTFEPMQPIWMTVRVPKDAKAGVYKGTVTVNAQGEKPVTTALEMEVIGDWVLPDAKDFKTYVGFLECADSVAAFYKVPMWSEQHWKYLDKTFEVLGQVGTKDLFVPLVAKTHQGNRNGMVRWIKQEDGSYKADTAIAEKYMDTALGHLGKIPVVCLFIAQYNQYSGKDSTNQPICTEWDPKTGETKDFLAPKWGTPESIKFWQPVLDHLRDFLAAKGMKDSMMFGYIAQDFPKPCDFFSDLEKMEPHTKWMTTSHLGAASMKAGNLNYTEVVGVHSWVLGTINIIKWMDDSDTSAWKPKYGWRDKVFSGFMLEASRSRHPTLDNDHCLQASRLRVVPECILLSRSGGQTWQGIGSWGADFWSNEWYSAPGSKGNQGASFADTGLSESTALWYVGPGQAGPVPTVRTRMLQEGLQEVEARIFVQDALLDQSQKLGPDLSKRAKELCDERTRQFSYMANFRYNDAEGAMPRQRLIPDPAAWDDNAVKLYRMADEVAKALRK